MNDEEIEEILRKAPGMKAPAGLAERLRSQVRLPRGEMGALPVNARSWLMRWLPAFSLAAFFVACLVAIGVQTSLISGLRTENEKLRAAAGNLEQLRAANADYQRLQAQLADAGQTERDGQDLVRLRSEAAQLRAQAAQALNLRALNQQLQISNAILRAKVTPTNADSDDVMTHARQDAEKIQCQIDLKQIGLAARTWTWSIKNHDVLPLNFISMREQLGNPTLLFCPADKSRTVTNWDAVAAGNVSYVMASPGVSVTFPAAVYAYCPIHHNYLLVDGSVQRLSPDMERRLLKRENGVLIMGQDSPPSPAPQNQPPAR